MAQAGRRRVGAGEKQSQFSTLPFKCCNGFRHGGVQALALHFRALNAVVQRQGSPFFPCVAPGQNFLDGSLLCFSLQSFAIRQLTTLCESFFGINIGVGFASFVGFGF